MSLKRQRPPRGRQQDLGWTNSSLSGTFPFNFFGSQHVVAISSGPPADGGETPSKHLFLLLLDLMEFTRQTAALGTLEFPSMIGSQGRKLISVWSFGADLEQTPSADGTGIPCFVHPFPQHKVPEKHFPPKFNQLFPQIN